MITLLKVVIGSTELLTLGRRRVTHVKMTSAPLEADVRCDLSIVASWEIVQGRILASPPTEHSKITRLL